MHKDKILTLTLALAAYTAPVLAVEQGTTYVGAGFSDFSLDIGSDEETEFKPKGLIGRIGHGVANNLAVERRLGVSISNDSIYSTDNSSVESVTSKIDALIGIYGVGYLPIGDAIDIYGLAGVSMVDASLETRSTNQYSTNDISESSGSFGLGAQGNIANDVLTYAE